MHYSRRTLRYSATSRYLRHLPHVTILEKGLKGRQEKRRAPIHENVHRLVFTNRTFGPQLQRC